jgi:hypothetical protein
MARRRLEPIFDLDAGARRFVPVAITLSPARNLLDLYLFVQ